MDIIIRIAPNEDIQLMLHQQAAMHNWQKGEKNEKEEELHSLNV